MQHMHRAACRTLDSARTAFKRRCSLNHAKPGSNCVASCAQTLEEMQAKVADREMTAARLQDEQRKAALLAQVLPSVRAVRPKTSALASTP